MSLYKFERHRVYGLVLGLVTNNDDPDKLGRVKVKYHMFDQTVESDWCRVVAMYAGAERGSYWMPEVDDEVVLAFEHGDVHFPFIIGSVWNGVDAIPTNTNTGKYKDGSTTGNDIKRIRSRSGHEITFDDKSGAEKLTILDSSTKNTIEIDVSANKITIEAATGDMDILCPKGTLKIECKELDLTASSKATMTSKGPLTVNASKALTINADNTTTLNGKGAVTLESKSNALTLKASTALSGSCASLSLKATSTGLIKTNADLTIKGAKVYIN